MTFRPDKGLTPNQQKVYDYCVAYYGDWGIPPTVRQIGEACALGTGGVHFVLNELERKGKPAPRMKHPSARGRIAQRKPWAPAEGNVEEHRELGALELERLACEASDAGDAERAGALVRCADILRGKESL